MRPLESIKISAVIVDQICTQMQCAPDVMAVAVVRSARISKASSLS